jgi:hypothetical protein
MRFDHEPILTAAGAHWSMPNSPAVAGALHRGSKSGKRARADQQQTDMARVRVIPSPGPNYGEYFAPLSWRGFSF